MEENETQDVALENNEAEDEKSEENKEDVADEVKALKEENDSLKETLGRTKRALTKKEKVESEEPSESKPDELDYGQKAFLVAHGVKGETEVQLVKDYISNTGKTLDDVLESSFFQNDLKDLRDKRETENAIPKEGKRGSISTKGSAEYWIAKGELPPDTPENHALRLEVVNARMKTEGEVSQFTETPVAGNRTT